ncbi:MAG: hypothetical protein RMK84_13020 [Oscillochloridaceae bacterium]|nr:hypothetical protein [Chloroflexaceae bacterium]MDW8391042.1 hypothetical protein [Oscillochloridaceae bacterium]
MAQTFVPACLPAPRAGLPSAGPSPAGTTAIVTLGQRGTHANPFALSLAGFPGLTFVGETYRAVVQLRGAERGLDRLALAYLRGERSVGAPPAEYQAALLEQVRPLEPARPRIVKVEVTGPISLSLLSVDEHERPLAYDPALREALGQHVALRARWLYEQIAMTGAAPLLCLDETFLEAVYSPFCPLDWDEGADLLARTLAELPGWRGLCVAGNMRWADLLELPADLIFFDAVRREAELVQAAKAIGQFLERGGALGWGVVPAEIPELVEQWQGLLTQRFIGAITQVATASGTPAEAIASRSLVSTCSTLSHLPADQAARAATLCAAIAAAAQAHFGLVQAPRPVAEPLRPSS